MQYACAVLCCYLWPVRLYHNFPHYPISGIIFGGGAVFGHNVCVLTCSTTSCEIFSDLKKTSARQYRKCTWSTRYSSQILMKLEFSPQIFDKSSTFKLNKNPTSGSRVAPCGRTDRQTDRTDMTKLIIAFRNFANRSRNGWPLRTFFQKVKLVRAQRKEFKTRLVGFIFW